MSSSDANEPKARKTIIYKGRRYDITNWIDRHPGGSVIKLSFSTAKGGAKVTTVGCIDMVPDVDALILAIIA